MARDLQRSLGMNIDGQTLEAFLGPLPHPPAAPAVRDPGELALMRAVLEDAIDCYMGNARRRRIHPKILEREAEYWIRIEDWEAPFSFNNVCEALGLDPDCTRERLLQMKAAGVRPRLRAA